MTGAANLSARGDFRFMVCRPGKHKGLAVSASEWLKGVVERDDVHAEAAALLDDPRDTITDVFVWSRGAQQFVGGFKRQS